MKFRSLIYSGAVLLTAAMGPATALAVANPFGGAAGGGAGTRGEATTQLNTLQERTGLQTGGSLPQIIGNIINIALGFMGVLLLVYLIFAGFLWMTSSGDEGVKKAKSMIQNAIIGLIIIVSAFAISNFVLGSLVKVTATS